MNQNESRTVLQAMRCCGFFESLDEDALVSLRPAAKRVAQPRGTVVFHQGDECRGFYIVEAGAVKIFKVSPDAREHVLHVAVPGDCFGEAALFLGKGYPASAAAVQDSSLIVFRKDEFLRILRESPDVSMSLMASMATWAHRLVSSIESLTLKDASARFAAYLLSRARGGDGQAASMHLGMQKQVLASHLGMTGETLSRLLARFEADGILETHGRRVTVQSFGKLEEIAESGRG